MNTLRIILLILPLTFVSCRPSSPSSAIEKVLNRCAEVSAEVNASGMSNAQAADYIASSFQQIDTRDCPQDFRQAFQQHASAWRYAAPYYEQDTGLNAFVEGFAAGATGDASMLGASQQAAQEASAYINATYEQLIQIGIGYGARIPESAVR